MDRESGEVVVIVGGKDVISSGSICVWAAVSIVVLTGIRTVIPVGGIWNSASFVEIVKG